MTLTTDTPSAETAPAEVDPRAAFTRGLREIADFLDAHPDVPLPYLESSAHSGGELRPSLPIYLWGDDQREQLAAIAREMGRAEKSANDRTKQFYVYRTFGGIDLVAAADRDTVCERVVVATEQVTKEVPDPEALAAVPTVTVVETVETVEWRCGSLLGGSVSS
jgi:hypothetical protein